MNKTILLDIIVIICALILALSVLYLVINIKDKSTKCILNPIQFAVDEVSLNSYINYTCMCYSDDMRQSDIYFSNRSVKR